MMYAKQTANPIKTFANNLREQSCENSDIDKNEEAEEDRGEQREEFSKMNEEGLSPSND